MKRAAVIALAYLAVTAAFVYGVIDSDVRLGHEDLYGVGSILTFVVLNVGAGLAIGRRWALVLPLAAIVVAIPAGRPPYLYHDPEPPVWMTLARIAPFAVLLVAIGVGVRGAVTQRAQRDRQQPSPPASFG